MRAQITSILVAGLLMGCNNDEMINNLELPDLGSPSDLFEMVYTPEQLDNQVFSIDVTKDTTLISNKGVLLKIFSGSFVDEENNKIEGDIQIEFKEALDKSSFVLANLTTMTNGRILESGGMIYVNATQNGKQLQLADDHVIGVSVPAKDTLQQDMQIYKGDFSYSEDTPCPTLNWDDPKPTLLDQIKIERTNYLMFWYWPDHFNFQDDEELLNDYQLLFDQIWNEKKYDQYTYHSYGKAGIEIIEHKEFPVEIKKTVFDDGRVIQEVLAPKGTNTFTEDYQTNYIFSMKKLGWANIDRLYEDDRTEEIEMVTSVDNKNEFFTVYTTLIFKNKNIYLAGYQKEDGTFAFTHGDYEKTALPVGESCTILATGYKNGDPYFDLREVVVSKDMDIHLNLKATNMDDLKNTLETTL